MFPYSLFQKPTSQYDPKTGRPADVSDDPLTVDTEMNRRQYLNDHIRDMMKLSSNLYSMLGKAGSFPTDNTVMNSLGAIIKQTPISFNGGEGIITEIAIRKCCMGEVCYTPDKDEACDATKIPVSTTEV